MTVYCEYETCIHNNDGICEHMFNGKKVVNLIETLGGQVICADQEDRGSHEECNMEKCPYSQDGKCKACGMLQINCEGEKYNLCAQYLIVTGKETPETIEQKARKL